METEQAAEAKLGELGYSWLWTDDGGLKATTPVLPAVVKLPNVKVVFYKQLIAAFMGWKGARNAIALGDGSAISVEGLQQAIDLAKDYTFDLPWQDGDVTLIDNYISMHGRRPYSGERKREVLVALVMN